MESSPLSDFDLKMKQITLINQESSVCQIGGALQGYIWVWNVKKNLWE